MSLFNKFIEKIRSRSNKIGTFFTQINDLLLSLTLSYKNGHLKYEAVALFTKIVFSYINGQLRSLKLAISLII